jgi:short-subunit dehydrogenase
MAKIEDFNGKWALETGSSAGIGAALARGQRTLIPNFSGRFTAFLVRFLPVGLITRFVERAARRASTFTF